MLEEHEPEPAPVATDGGFEWERKPHDATREHLSIRNSLPAVSRYKARAVIVGLLVLLAVTYLYFVPGLTYAHTTFTAEDVSVTGNAGQLQTLTIAPSGDVHYDGLEAEPSSAEVTVSTKLSSSSTWETVGTESVSTDGLEGTANFSFSEIDLLDETSMEKADFRAADDATEETDVDVKLEVILVGAGPDDENVTGSSSDTMTVSVTNEKAGVGAGGQANSGGGAR